MGVTEKSTWLLLDERDKLKVVTNLLNNLKIADNLKDKRSAKTQLLNIINWLDESDE